MTFLQIIERDLGRGFARLLRWLIWLAVVSLFIHIFLLVFFPAFAMEAGTDVQTAFSPSGGATELVVHTIESAKYSIRVAAYSFTSKRIAQALLEAHRRGIDVRVVVDKSNATARYTAATFLANMGVPVRIDYRYAIMHDKYIVVDGATVETGSFNLTSGAEFKNAENVIVLHDPVVAQQYGQEWERLWGESEEIKARY